MSTIDVGMRLGDTMTHFIWQTDLKPLSGTNTKNGAITLSLTPTMHVIHARCARFPLLLTVTFRMTCHLGGWFSVASPGPAGIYTENAVSPLLLRARAQLGWIPNV